MTKGLITIVISGHKNIDRAEETFEALFEIKEKHRLEVIYIEDESNFQFLDLAKSYGAAIVRIKGGAPTLARIRNEGLKRAKGEFIFFLDSGSILHADFFDAAMAFFKDPKVYLVLGDIRELNPERSVYGSFIDYWSFKHRNEMEESISMEGLFRKASLQVLFGFNSKLGEAAFLDLSYRAFKKGFKLQKLNEKMELKPLDIDTFFDFWRYYKQKGTLLAKLSKRPRSKALGIKIKELKTAGILFAVAAFVFLMLFYENPLRTILFFGAATAFFLILKSYLQRQGTSSWDGKTRLFFLFLSFIKPLPVLFGFLKQKLKQMLSLKNL